MFLFNTLHDILYSGISVPGLCHNIQIVQSLLNTICDDNQSKPCLMRMNSVKTWFLMQTPCFLKCTLVNWLLAHKTCFCTYRSSLQQCGDKTLSYHKSTSHFSDILEFLIKHGTGIMPLWHFWKTFNYHISCVHSLSPGILEHFEKTAGSCRLCFVASF